MTAPETIRLIEAYGSAAMALDAGGSAKAASDAMAVLLEHLSSAQLSAAGSLTDERIVEIWREVETTTPWPFHTKRNFARAIESAVRSQVPAPPADERAAFEAWIADIGMVIDEDSFTRRMDDGYFNPILSSCWSAWQARAALR